MTSNTKPAGDLWPQTAQKSATHFSLCWVDWPHKRAKTLPHLALCLITVCVKSPPASRLFQNQRQSVNFSCASFLFIPHPPSPPYATPSILIWGCTWLDTSPEHGCGLLPGPLSEFGHLSVAESALCLKVSARGGCCSSPFLAYVIQQWLNINPDCHVWCNEEISQHWPCLTSVISLGK